MKKNVVISILFFILGSFINFYSVTDSKNQDKKENEHVEVFFDKEENEKKLMNKETDPVYEYTSILEIPKISLKKGMVDKNSVYNNVDTNITILKESSMPNEDNHTFILAAHSGNANVSYFKNLNKILVNDIIYVYYKNIKYTYKVNNIYEQEKGLLTIKNNSSENNLIVLTTCKPITDDKQYTVVAHLINKSSY